MKKLTRWALCLTTALLLTACASEEKKFDRKAVALVETMERTVDCAEQLGRGSLTMEQQRDLLQEIRQDIETCTEGMRDLQETHPANRTELKDGIQMTMEHVNNAAYEAIYGLTYEEHRAQVADEVAEAREAFVRLRQKFGKNLENGR